MILCLHHLCGFDDGSQLLAHALAVLHGWFAWHGALRG